MTDYFFQELTLETFGEKKSSDTRPNEYLSLGMFSVGKGGNLSDFI